jgi:hypothetical protein
MTLSYSGRQILYRDLITYWQKTGPEQSPGRRFSLRKNSSLRLKPASLNDLILCGRYQKAPLLGEGVFYVEKCRTSSAFPAFAGGAVIVKVDMVFISLIQFREGCRIVPIPGFWSIGCPFSVMRETDDSVPPKTGGVQLRCQFSPCYNAPRMAQKSFGNQPPQGSSASVPKNVLL